MIEYLKHKFALSEQGAKDMIKAFEFYFFANISAHW